MTNGISTLVKCGTTKTARVSYAQKSSSLQPQAAEIINASAETKSPPRAKWYKPRQEGLMGLTGVGVQGETQVTAIPSSAHLNPVTTLSKANDSSRLIHLHLLAQKRRTRYFLFIKWNFFFYCRSLKFCSFDLQHRVFSMRRCWMDAEGLLTLIWPIIKAWIGEIIQVLIRGHQLIKTGADPTLRVTVPTSCSG